MVVVLRKNVVIVLIEGVVFGDVVDGHQIQ